MPQDGEDNDSLRAWSAKNSLFSGNSGNTTSTAATEYSQSSQKLQVVPELESNDGSVPLAVPVRARGSPMPRDDAIPFAQTVSQSVSAPRRAQVQRSNSPAYQRTASQAQHQQIRSPPSPLPSHPAMSSTATGGSTDPARPPVVKRRSASSLFGDPNMKVPVVPQTKSQQVVPHTTHEVLEETAEAITRLFESVLADPWPSLLVTRAATTAQRIEDCARRVEPHQVVGGDCQPLAQIIRAGMGFQDVLLRSSSYRSSRQSLANAMEMLGVALGLVEHDQDAAVLLTRNFALCDDAVNAALCDRLLNELGASQIFEQEGSYIAPVFRGLSPKFGVSTLCIGIPFVNETHWQQVMALSRTCPEIHFYVRGDCILPAQQQQQQQQQKPRVLPPFRTPSNPSQPPMSISLAPSKNQTSGTLGGYIHPVIDASNSAFSQFRDSTFALTCGHVCLADDDPQENIDKPVLTPSPVLVSIFRKALQAECKRYSPDSMEGEVYNQAMQNLEQNPPRSLGSLVWGERDLVTTKLGQSMSDVAIICCDPQLTCRNDLGDDINLTQHDLGLTFERTVTHVISPELLPGLEVFKYGSTTRFTSGRVCASKIIYWANNRLKSTEFVVRGDTPTFASSGDSGAWVLARGAHTGPNGLGVAGMIHSFDGEFKEFGLFTPMESILERLEQVTTVPWAVVGVSPN